MIQYGCKKLQVHYCKDLSICMLSHQKVAVLNHYSQECNAFEET